MTAGELELHSCEAHVIKYTILMNGGPTKFSLQQAMGAWHCMTLRLKRLNPNLESNLQLKMLTI